MIHGAMLGAVDAFVGRVEELAALRAAVREATEGHGSVSFVCGEAGIGKSRLAEELARTCDGQLVTWGRCWEEGGAPPYWPWTQVLRTLLRRRSVGSAPLVAAGRGPWLTQLVPELEEHVSDKPPPLEPDQARFRLLDAAVGALCDAAEREPLLVILEDLHAADASSVDLLGFLAHQIHGARIAIVATLREQEARRSTGYPVLTRLQREARHVALAPLSRDAVKAFLGAALGRPPEPPLVDAMMRTTEGNPLFLSEIARRRAGLLSVEHRGGAPVIPQSLQMAISERVDELSPTTRDLLVTASALGREVSTDALAEVSGAGRAELTQALAEAVDRAVVVEVAPELYRFSHILVRETLHQAIDVERRRELHRRMAASLERAGSGQWSRIALHYVEAGPACRDDAVRALGRAAEHSTARLAFREAAAFHRQALDLLAEAPADRERCEILLGLVSALAQAGDLEAARAESRRALQLARALDESELFARSALGHGAILEIGTVSDELIALLEEALDRLEPGDSAARARVMARLGAAKQPATRPEQLFDLVRRAFAMARRVGDQRALLDSLRTGISALMDLSDPTERLALNREHAALAEALGEPLDVLLAHQRMFFDGAELGDMGVVTRALETCARMVDELSLDQRRWRVSLMHSIRATLAGDLDAADRAGAQATAEAATATEPWAERTMVMAAHHRALLRGRWDEALALVDRIDPLLAGFDFGHSMATLMRATTLARSGRREEAEMLWEDELAAWPLELGDLSLLEVCGEVLVCVDRAQLRHRVLERLRPEAHRFMSWGILGGAVGPPAGSLVGRLLVAAGEPREGEQYLREALARARATGCSPHVAWICLYIARLAHARDARERAEEALELAEALSMPGLIEIARARLAELDEEEATAQAAAAAPVPTVGYFQMRHEGGVWVFDCDGETFHLKDLKGLALLSRLVEARGRELHVLDLESPTGAATPDGGDAGEAIDAEARLAYRRRVEELRGELEEAERWNDAGRAERAREELEAIEAELARAIGLGGRPRRSASQAERARVNVQRRLKDAIRRIETQHPALGKHLSWAVRTGTFCSYQPD